MSTSGTLATRLRIWAEPLRLITYDPLKAAANDEHLFAENNGFQQMLTKQLFVICGALNINIKIDIIEQKLMSNKC